MATSFARRRSSDGSVVAARVNATIVAQGPPVAFFGNCVIDDVLYVHGGVKTRGDTHPSNQLYIFENNTWNDITTSSSPSLSYHRLIPYGKKYIISIGGWTGHERTSDICVYDIETKNWHKAHSTGFPEGGGLNNHAIISLRDGSILVSGRDGGLRTQRKHGDVYKLSGDPAKGTFRYEDYPISASSRSGHTLTAHGSSLFIIGGRADHFVERYPGVKAENLNNCDDLHSQLKSILSEMTPMKKPPASRKDHTSVSCKDFALIYGGETFDGRTRDPVGDTLVLHMSGGEEWFNLGPIEYGRQGHSISYINGRLIVHGGLGPKALACSETFSLDFV
ncbi:unnamed protein product [Didymodactylos carnosus]|uniref:Kelch repeat-containing protein n=1 Tax=Didymodactylos carnosus TaxID=1234261 RepID=A0A813PVV2_9BILA|nr:unnamed protein product [Didymodactylos carnosus]CAF1397485.1 unnamed protein product [Didymodactylos carnosus]CAF3534488.1 unnamed protein product [Didymodactylos carnosus]CAF4204832.1 unnamed protein product [Didymodactylos carnosus]